MLTGLDEATHAAVPADRLLDFRLGVDGYPELCTFLEVPPSRCPAGPFPHVNARGELERLATTLLALHYAVRVVAAGVLVLAAYGAHAACGRCRCCRWCCGQRGAPSGKGAQEQHRLQEQQERRKGRKKQ
jgi:hypothetical protein